MRSAMHTAHRLRLAAVLALGAFAVHQLRYLIAFGESSSVELGRQGHGYMSDAVPALVVVALSAVLATLLRARLGSRLLTGSIIRRTAILALALLLVYGVQESLEGLLSAGHPSGVAAMLADDGWLAIPLSGLLGLAAATLIRALEIVEHALSAPVPRSTRSRAPRALGLARAELGRRGLDAPLAFGLARRPPPSVAA